jgi:hypothetical protein
VIFQRNEFEEEYENNAKEIGGGIMGPAIKQGIAVLATRAQRPSTTDINGDSPSKRSSLNFSRFVYLTWSEIELF